MTLKTISPREAKTLVDEGALLIDVREPNEFAAEHIHGAITHPLSRLRSEKPVTPADGQVIFMCQSGARTGGNAGALASCTSCEGYILEGGLSAWKQAGLPVEGAMRQPISIIRQVLITAGTLIVLGFLLGLFVAPLWHVLSAAVGAGLAFAGVTDICPMARLLSKMPWNRVAPQAGTPAGSGSPA